MKEIADYCADKKIFFWEYVEECEGKEIWDFLAEVWKEMQHTIER
jgi:L-serine dehydratase